MYSASDLTCRDVKSLNLGYPAVKPRVPEAVFEARKQRLVEAIRAHGLDVLAIYADREHYANFKHYTGVDPRFEEALLVVHADGRAFCALGNECYSLAAAAAIEVTPVLCQMFSLPNQPMDQFQGIRRTLEDCGVAPGMRAGLVDWKLITPRHGEGFRRMFGMPAYLVAAVEEIVGDPALVTNETALLISPEGGLRLKVGADAIAEFEYGATCASQSVIDMLNLAKPGMSERELANAAQMFGQQLSCHEYVVAGPNTRRGLVSPSNYVLAQGDDIVVSLGMEGGLTCRRAVLAHGPEEMELNGKYYLEEIVKPYMAAVFNWYEMIGIGTCCGDMFEMIQSCLPKEKYGWTLNPGHMIGYEEWMCAPFYAGSEMKIESGMMFQMDIIPSDPVYPTPNAEDGLAIADAELRAELERKYPEVYARIMARRKFAEEQIGLRLKPEVLPLANCFAEFRPFVLRPECAIAVAR